MVSADSALAWAYIMPASSRGHCNTSASFSDGDIPSRVCRGLPLREWAALSRSAWVSRLMSVPWESIGGVVRWCFRWSHAAMDFWDHRNTPGHQCRWRIGRVGPSLCPDPRSTTTTNGQGVAGRSRRGQCGQLLRCSPQAAETASHNGCDVPPGSR